MKRKEFLSRLKHLGYKGKQYEHNHFINVLDEDGKFVAYVSEIKEYDYEMYSITDELLISLIFEYTKTPIEDREEEVKRYTLSLPMQYSDEYLHATYLHKVDDETYLFNVEEDLYPISTFTQEEIDNLPNQDFIKSLVKEEV